MPGASTPAGEQITNRRWTNVVVAFSVAVLAFLALVPASQAAKQAVDFFGKAATGTGGGTSGGEFGGIPSGVAVNYSGAGGVPSGTVYALDSQIVYKQGQEQEDGAGNRIERFQREDNGTPGNSSDDSYKFISAWGAGVDAAQAGEGYEICTVAAECKDGLASGENGTAAGNGSLNKPVDIAVDQDTGEVYVLDAGNRRINVYEADGDFLRSFGYDVVDSGPSDAGGPNEQQTLTVKATGGHFSLAFKGKTTGAVGTGSRQPGSTLIETPAVLQGTLHVGEGISGQGIAPGTTITAITPSAVVMSQPSDTINGLGNETPFFGDNFRSNPSAAEVQSALNALPSIGGAGGSATVSGGPGDASGSSPYTIDFSGSLGGRDLPSIVPTSTGLTNSGSASAAVAATVNGGAYEVCSAAAGDVCRAGSGGVATGEFGEGLPPGGGWDGAGLAVSSPDGNPASGSVFAADIVNKRVNTYRLDGSTPGSVGSPAVFGSFYPTSLAVDSRGIVYIATRQQFGSENSEVRRFDSEDANGGGVGFLAPITTPLLRGVRGLAVDPDGDGAGPDTDVLYVSNPEYPLGQVEQFGPLNPPGLSAPPGAADEVHGTSGAYSQSTKLAVEPTTGRIYISGFPGSMPGGGTGIYVLDEVSSTPPTVTVDSIDGVTSSSATVHATIDPHGPPNLSYQLEYSLDGQAWTPMPTVLLGSQETPQAVSISLNPPGGLEANTLYHVRVFTAKKFQPPVVSTEQTFTTLAEKPLAESTGSPVRTATTARLEGRVAPRNLATTYHFEFGDQGPCDANPCTATPAHPVGSGATFQLVAQQVEDLQPSTTYHYRVVAESPAPGSPSLGEDMTVTTRSSDAPLSHGRPPGPPGSDRAWEQVSIPDTGGNPLVETTAVSDDGNRAFYRVAGGTPISTTGTFYNGLFAERTASGWRSENIFPARDQLVATGWLQPTGRPDLSDQVVVNFSGLTGAQTVWRLRPGQPASKVFQPEQNELAGPLIASEDASRVLMRRGGSLDPAHPVLVGTKNVYDVSSGTAKLISLLPDGSVPACGARGGTQKSDFQADGPSNVDAGRHWLTADGSHFFFPSQGNDCSGITQLYMWDFEAQQSKLLSGPRVSGGECDAAFLKSTLDGAGVFFLTATRLQANDTEPAGCGAADQDVYRYGIDSGELTCVTCVVPGRDADVTEALVAPDGSRVYFNSSLALLPGAAAGGMYRVMVDSGALAYVSPVGEAREGSTTSHIVVTPNGKALLFAAAGKALDVIGGGQGGGKNQFYRYDDEDGSLVCVSCPQDGSEPATDVAEGPLPPTDDLGGANHSPLSADGEIAAFGTDMALLPADQNTARPGQETRTGRDIYEWRDGRLLLVTDGLQNWTASETPQFSAMSPSGWDIFIEVAAQYTPDTLDAYRRLFDARIGGGFEFPPPPKPCPLEVCQGTPKGTPEEQAPGTGTFAGAAKAPVGHRAKPRKKKKAHKAKVHKKKQHKGAKKKRATNDRRTQR